MWFLRGLENFCFQPLLQDFVAGIPAGQEFLYFHRIAPDSCGFLRIPAGFLFPPKLSGSGQPTKSPPTSSPSSKPTTNGPCMFKIFCTYECKTAFGTKYPFWD